MDSMTVGPTELRTERLLLRPFQFGDLDDVIAYATDQEWSRYLSGIPQPYTRHSGQEFVAKAVLTEWEREPLFAMVLDGKVIGGISLRVEREHRLAELGYSIAREHWGKGLAAEAGRALIGWAFHAYNLDKIFARADANNRGSWRVMEKLGMTREGLLRSHRLVRGERDDEVIYGLLRREWEAGAV
jgi:ribosomal-protein-alanine N-acetyltransferase